MLRIKRVPTILSNYQKEEAEDGGATRGCGRNCLRNCCITGAKLPLYAFPKSNKKVDSCDKIEFPFSFLDSLLLGEVIPGEHGFVAQLNEGRHLKKRPTEFQVDKVLQPFDENKFNFTKVGQEEVLFQFEASEDNEVSFHPNASVDLGKSPSVVAINVSPIEYGHVLLIPRILERLPQRIDHESLLLALYMAREAASPHFRLGYNSLGAFATINHLHFQAYYLAVPFPIEKAPTRKISEFNGGVLISEIFNYPVKGLVFEGGNSLEDLSNVVADSCICLQNNNIPYNCYAEKQALGEVSPEVLDTQVNPAVWEISGHMVLKRKEDYEWASEEKAWRLLAEVSLSEERFHEVITIIFDAISCGVNEKKLVADDHQDIDQVGGVNNGPNADAAVVPGKQECLVQY
ncbi:hypothetical protein Ccrd_011199 [Cynara cardunculus var. scolymus]|uniref:GDP-L-galactose phosphorylase n=1 Tax=Cynara cardunculus var. scolymus TaxID=59895 RepID=A0A118K6A7_CYNCS|nr:hypothetical protein Ccrd_011199 [Cynara cardunculus var. scolymus]